MHQELLRKLPQVEKVLQWPAVEKLILEHSRAEVTHALQESLARLRRQLLDGDMGAAGAREVVSEEALVARLRGVLSERALSGYRRVINGTGVVLHTGLGRAILPEAALEAFRRELGGYSLVEVAPGSGERNHREEAVRDLLRELTGASAATVVNNNAGATLIILAALARDREVIISRGQLVEIGGSFRIPDILRESGARLVEVGTTNRTHLRDYRDAVTDDTGLLLKVHTSNYEIRGFTSATSLEDLVALGREHGIPVVSDLGSGCFVDVSRFGFRREPLVSESVDAGADLVCFSGDKLLGGPQAGVIVGTEEAVGRVRAHPLFRALRVDKTSLVLLEATLRLYRDAGAVWSRIPVLRLLSMPAAEIRARLEAFLSRWQAAAGDAALDCEIAPTTSESGSGSLPAQAIPSWALSLAHQHLSPGDLAAALRSGTPPVFSRLHEERVLLDFRTVQPSEEDELLEVLGAVCKHRC